MTRRHRVARCHARMSMEPRSPKIEKDASGLHSQPSRASSAITEEASAAWARSSRRSSSAPRQRGRISIRTWSAAATRRTSATVISPRSPPSSLDTVAIEQRAAAATSAWRRPRLMRTARSTAPRRRSSTAPRLRRRGLSGAYQTFPPGTSTARRSRRVLPVRVVGDRASRRTPPRPPKGEERRCRRFSRARVANALEVAPDVDRHACCSAARASGAGLDSTKARAASTGR